MSKQKQLEESVFAISTEKLWGLLPYKKTGFIEGDSKALNRIVQNGLFRKRCLLEEDPSFKQIIPYAIISDRQSLILFTRESGQREKRLHHKLHLGLGGHMNPPGSIKLNHHYPVSELKRELFEELGFLNDCRIEDIEFIGFINDDTVPVGQVHLGLLYNINLSNKDVIVNETEKMTAKWINMASLKDYYTEIETWSKIAIDNYLI